MAATMMSLEVTCESLLSDRQVELLQAIADGSTTAEAAAMLGITVKTGHNHLSAAYRRLDVQNLTHAVLAAVRLGLVSLDRVSVAAG